MSDRYLPTAWLKSNAPPATISRQLMRGDSLEALLARHPDLIIRKKSATTISFNGGTFVPGTLTFENLKAPNGTFNVTAFMFTGPDRINLTPTADGMMMAGRQWCLEFFARDFTPPGDIGQTSDRRTWYVITSLLKKIDENLPFFNDVILEAKRLNERDGTRHCGR